jgi:macrodomain Ter protein organizer (MatP/YcbG family)
MTTTARRARTRPLHTISLAPEVWGRLDEIARRLTLSRSGTIAQLILQAEMPNKKGKS